MRPGATSAVLRWRVGAWLVGTGALLFVADLLFLDQGPGFWSFCLFLVVIGSLIANPMRMMGRLRAGGPTDPVVRLRPLGIIGFIVMMVLFLVPFAVGEWFLNLIGELFERRAGRPSDGEDGMSAWRRTRRRWPATRPCRGRAPRASRASSTTSGTRTASASAGPAARRRLRRR